jgi:hypothetical protein
MKRDVPTGEWCPGLDGLAEERRFGVREPDVAGGIWLFLKPQASLGALERTQRCGWRKGGSSAGGATG